MRKWICTLIFSFSSYNLGSTFMLKPCLTLTGKNITATVYQGVTSQTDNEPTLTAVGVQFDKNAPPNWIAISPDLLESIPFYSDVYLYGTEIHDGMYKVMDRTSRRYNNHIDILIPASVRPGDRRYGKWRNITIYVRKN